MGVLMRKDFPHLSPNTGRDGKTRWYYRRAGRKVRIKADWGSRDFAAAYVAAKRQHESGVVDDSHPAKTAPKGSFGWLAAQYFQSRRFLSLDAKSRTTRRLVIEECLRESDGGVPPDPFAACPIARLNAAAVMLLMDRKIAEDRPKKRSKRDGAGAANNRKKYLSAMFGWAVKAKHMVANPARDAERVAYATDGFHTWTVDEVRQFEEKHPIGTKARLALALLLFTGARRGDAVTLGRQHVKDGMLRYVPRKTRYKRRDVSEKPVLPELAHVIANSPCGDLTFLVTEYGKAFTAAGFGGWFRKQCDDADLPHCTAHGLRKAGATLAAEGGATDREMMALFDWSTSGQATAYTAKADKKRLAGKAARILVGQFSEGALPHAEKSR